MKNDEITITVSSIAGVGKSSIMAIINKSMLDSGITDVKMISYYPIPLLTDDVKAKVKDKKIIIKELQLVR